MFPPTKNMVIPKVPTLYTQQKKGLKDAPKRYGKTLSKVLRIVQSRFKYHKNMNEIKEDIDIISCVDILGHP